MKPDYGFAVLMWTMWLGPAFAAFITGNWWFLALYVPVFLIFGMA